MTKIDKCAYCEIEPVAVTTVMIVCPECGAFVTLDSVVNMRLDSENERKSWLIWFWNAKMTEAKIHITNGNYYQKKDE